jgi:hypothetical protein
MKTTERKTKEKTMGKKKMILTRVKVSKANQRKNTRRDEPSAQCHTGSTVVDRFYHSLTIETEP